MPWTLNNLPETVGKHILKSYHLSNVKKYREKTLSSKVMKADNNLFSFASAPVTGSSIQPIVREDVVIWATDNYVDDGGKDYGFSKPIHDLSIIIPRVEKSKLDQKKRTKQKAEVFTPSFVANEQNNLIDDQVLYPGAFNTGSITAKSWTPNPNKVRFTEEYTWVHYVMERRLEMTAGEGPYLMSPYDTTTGDVIPVRNSDGVFQRIGLLDRKLRIVSENATNDEWVRASLLALEATFGYEWQGDNLLLARLNFINTFCDYHEDYFDEQPSEELLEKVAEIASWNLWQMDGLKMIVPLSCKNDCSACIEKKNAGHDGVVSLIKFGEVKTFEELLPVEKFSKPEKKRAKK